MPDNMLDTKTILAERRDLDYADKIIELEPSAGPLTLLLKKLGKTTVDTAEFAWFEGTRNTRWISRNGAAEASPQTTIPLHLGEASLMRVGELLKVPRTGEVMSITALDTTTDTATVVRGYGSTAAAVLNDDEPLLIMANAYEEGADIGVMKVTQPVKKRNYTQIIRNPVMITRTLAKEKQRATPEERIRLQKKVGIEHLIDIEYALWFGEPKEDLTGTHPKRTTGGVLYWVTDNVLDVATAGSPSGTLTYWLFETWLESLFRYGSKTKWLFAAPRLVSVLDTIAVTKLETRIGEDTYGLAIKEWVSAHGTLKIVKHDLFEGAEYGKMGVAIDLDTDYLDYVYLEDSDTKLRLNIGKPSVDGYYDEYLTEMGLRFPEAKRHGKITGVNAAG